MPIVVLLFLAHVGWNPNPAASWVSLLVGGAVGVLLMLLIFDWALITFSSLIGAILIVESTGIPGAWSATLVLVCLVIGLVVQGASLLREGG